MKDKLLEFFRIFPWADDPESEEGKKYYNFTIKNMDKLLKHPWFEDILKKKEIKILEICGGAGFGSIALSKLLLEKDLEIDLIITDLRKEVLKRAKKFGEKALKRDIMAKVMDAKEVHKLRKKFDIALMYGLSTPHFSPWDIIKVFSSVNRILEDDGIFIIDEVDRRYKTFLMSGYKWVLGEGKGDKFVISFHTGYDILKGTFKRTFFNPTLSKKPLTIEFYFWGLSEMGALIFLFFKDVDFLHINNTRYFILGYKPRRILKPEEFKEPFLFRKNIL
ncbi:MAG: class I SAM-dependent methyltransferase [candidate division WOR-3 bacterium]|nr:class I SAM-dependent methyltransferase [candidate division WOR-3 bacterium]MCX7837040.1 class I SAM-dependent methyltransferase [candidate division WOR-3 bacterium]MDW8113919.1 class I SAM-dependent methyltransferase [candidate division WOR-3 bacterium]